MGGATRWDLSRDASMESGARRLAGKRRPLLDEVCEVTGHHRKAVIRWKACSHTVPTRSRELVGMTGFEPATP